ncbi:MAG: hypothetical protein FWC06_05530 [Treponema sp.]|nr:hypothetical protein [Treponema sp.]
MVKETLSIGEKLTEAQIAEINTAATRTVIYTNDAPRLTAEELAEFKKVNSEARKK